MDLKLADKKVIIFGASKGIGKAIACAFATEKCELVLAARSKDLLSNVAQNCMDLGAKSVAIETVDVVNDDLSIFCKNLNQKYGTFDVVVHSIGTSLTSRNIFGGRKDYLESIDINALHAIELNSFLIPQMIKKHNNGRVIHVSSISAKMLRGNALYASSKAFLNAYITTAGRELAKHGICINSVMPGAVRFENSYWDIKVKANDPSVEDFLKHHQAIGRFGSPEEIASLVVFLASDKASFICGSNIEIDGGNM